MDVSEWRDPSGMIRAEGSEQMSQSRRIRAGYPSRGIRAEVSEREDSSGGIRREGSERREPRRGNLADGSERMDIGYEKRTPIERGI